MDFTPFSNDNAKIKVSHQGAHVTSWRVNNCEQLYLSPLCQFENGKAIRGGIPVIFPQFESFGSGARHGFARIAHWTPHKSDNDVLFKMERSNDHYKIWPHKAEVHLRVEINDRQLHLGLIVENTDDKPLEFTCALHTYFSVSDIKNVQIKGLQGLNFWTNNGSDFKNRDTQKEPLVTIDQKTDRIYFNAKNAIELHDGKRQLSLVSEGFEDAVVWNPWAEDTRQLADMPDGDFEKMVCIEPARVDRPVVLEPNESWTGKHIISVLAQ